MQYLFIPQWGRQRIELEKRNEYEKREAIIDRTETKDSKQEVQENGDAGKLWIFTNCFFILTL